VLRRYLQLITRHGVTQGIFPEGGLTRDGALRAPKAGLLDALLQLAGESELYFVPVGINYDRVLEDEALLAELRGRERPPTRAEKIRGALRLACIVPWRTAVNALRVATGRLQRHGYVAVAFGEPVRFRDLPQSRGIGELSDADRRARAKEVAALLMERIAQVIPATPVALVAKAALELPDGASMAELASRVRALRAELEERGVRTAMGREFDPHRAAREGLREDLARTRDLARLEGDLLASEEAEQVVQLGLERLARRGALSVRDGQVSPGRHPHARDLLLYYARSIDRPGERSDARPLEAQRAARP
jgi:glycerol-3-phosphate O-acyltransferase